MTPEELERLERRRDILKASVDSLGSWLIGFIVAVVVGLGIELYRPITSLTKHFELIVLVELIGTALVTIGVAGELFVGWKTHRKEKELLGIDTVIEREDKKTIGQLNLSLARSSERIAELTLLAEKEAHERALLEAQVSHVYDRRLSEREVSILKQAIRSFRGQTFWIIIQTSNSFEPSEAKAFGNQLESILKAEGWILTPQIQGQFTLIKYPGVDIGYSLKAQDAAAKLHEALTGFHIKMRDLTAHPHLPLDLMVIEIGFN